MAIELTRLFEEVRYYKTSEENFYLIRSEKRDMSMPSYKWHLTVVLREVDKMGFTLSEICVLECKNYTRDSNQRRFRELCVSRNFGQKLFKIERFFFTNDKKSV